MGFFESIFGGDTGAGFSANGVSNQDLTNSISNVQNSQSQQNALLAALQNQNGIRNQNSVYNQQQVLLGQLGAVNGIGNQQSALQAQQQLAAQQQGLAGQYQNLANGVGPNPAQAQLAQNTAANVAQTGALMAGQRGASQNVGLIARQAAQQGAQAQQQAVGQAATLQAQQQLAGLSGLANQQAAIGGTNQNIAGIAQNQVGQQQSQQTNAANLATQQAGQQLSASQAAANTALGNQSNIYGLQSNINTTNAGIAAGNQKAQAGLIGGVLGSVGAGSANVGGQGQAYGGEIRKYADGGPVAVPGPQVQTPNAYVAPPQTGAQSYIGRYMNGQIAPGGGGLNQDQGKSGQQMGESAYNLAKTGYQAAKSLFNKGEPEIEPGIANNPGVQAGSFDQRMTLDKLVGQEGQVNGSTFPSTVTAGSPVEGATDAAAAAGSSEAGISGAEAAATAAEEAAATLAAEEGGAEAAALFVAKGGQIEPGYDPHNPDPSTIGGTLQDIMSYLNKGGMPRKDLQSGGKVKASAPSQKATKSGDSYSNDKIPAVLSEGEVVIPRSVMMSKDPVRNAAAFVQAVLAKKRTGR